MDDGRTEARKGVGRGVDGGGGVGGWEEGIGGGGGGGAFSRSPVPHLGDSV